MLNPIKRTASYMENLQNDLQKFFEKIVDRLAVFHI